MQRNLIKIFDFHGRPGDLLELFKDEPYLFCLESNILNKDLGRFSFIGFDPFEIFQSNGKESLTLLKRKFQAYSHLTEPASISPLESGLVGFLSYDFGYHLENISHRPKRGFDIPDCFFGFYDCVITVDHVLKKLIISCSGLPEQRSHSRLKKSHARFKKIIRQLNRFWSNPTEQSSSRDVIRVNSTQPLELVSNFTKKEYVQSINQILEHIRRGDVYQVNLSQRFEFPKLKHVDYIDLYRKLNHLSAVNFGGYFDCGKFKIISNSPERFIKLVDRIVTATPMKGTRPRGASRTEDRKYQRDLLHSAKDKAELLMITDLYRNDLGKVCEYGSVKVKSLRTIETYSTVFQSTSTLQGILKKGLDGFDVLRACFPGGSVTGCPKIRAMEIIESLEPTRRGIYTGALGYISFAQQMDFNILIRTLLGTASKMYFQSGGGIVADSDPQEEYAETLVKTEALRLCLKQMKLP